MYEKELRRILDASQNNALTFFVGAGVSALSGAPTWKALIDAICDELGCEKKGSYSSEEYLQIPQMFYYSLGENKTDYFKFVKEQLPEAGLQSNEIHRQMLNLNPVSFITTNYDTLLEDTAIQHCQSFKVVSSDEKVPTIFGDRFILKVHGDFEKNNFVLKEEDYLNYSEDFKLIETLTKSIFSTNTVVFIGYLRKEIEKAKESKSNNGVYVYPATNPYNELVQVGYWCLRRILRAKDYKEFLGNSDEFDFYYEYSSFDFNKFDVSWLLNLYPQTFNEISKNKTVKNKIRIAIVNELKNEELAEKDKKNLQDILINYFC